MKYDLQTPNEVELVEVIKCALQSRFEYVLVEMVDCPDLRKKPFDLLAPGLCGRPTLADVGGEKNLLPLADLSKTFHLDQVLNHCHLSQGALMGAGAGPLTETCSNSELVANMFESRERNHLAYITDTTPDSKYSVIPSPSLGFSLLGNFLCCQGTSGKVLHIRTSHRKPMPEPSAECDVNLLEAISFSSVIRGALADKYDDGTAASVPIGLGGVFTVKNAPICIHIMPAFSQTPLLHTCDVMQWLRFFDVEEPMTFVGYLLSHDPLRVGFRLNHFHGVSESGRSAGHYHFDRPSSAAQVQGAYASVEYEAYFVVAQNLVKLD